MKKMNNKGFSLVELIIVIAIMAILAGAIAPALIKYIDKSRRSSDVNNAQSIATAVSSALAKEDAYDAAVALIGTDVAVSTLSTSSSDAFVKEVADNLSPIPTVKYKKDGATDFQISIFTDGSGKTAFKITLDSGEELYPDVDAAYK